MKSYILILFLTCASKAICQPETFKKVFPFNDSIRTRLANKNFQKKSALDRNWLFVNVFKKDSSKIKYEIINESFDSPDPIIHRGVNNFYPIQKFSIDGIENFIFGTYSYYYLFNSKGSVVQDVIEVFARDGDNMTFRYKFCVLKKKSLVTYEYFMTKPYNAKSKYYTQADYYQFREGRYKLTKSNKKETRYSPDDFFSPNERIKQEDPYFLDGNK